MHTTTDNGSVVHCSLDENEVESVGNVASSNNNNNYDPPPFIPAVVQLIEAKEGAYMLDFESTHDSNMFAKKANSEAYIDRTAWIHLLAYSEFAGKPITRENIELELKHPLNIVNLSLDTKISSFVSLDDDATNDQELEKAARECTTQIIAIPSSNAQMCDSSNASSIEGLQCDETRQKSSTVCTTSGDAPTVASAICDSEIEVQAGQSLTHSNENSDTRTDHSPVLYTMSIVGSKIQPAAKAVSLRCQLLRRATLQFDTLKFMFGEMKGQRLRGIKLLQSKVKLVITIRRFLGISQYQIQAVAPETLDIFSQRCYAKPLQIIPSGGRVNREELLERAIAHRNQTLCRKIVRNWMSWKSQVMAEHQRKEDAIQNATTAHQRTLTLRCFRALRMYSTQQRSRRANAANASKSNTRKEIAFAARSPPRIDDETPVLVSELDVMEPVVGKKHPSGLNVFLEDFQHYAGYLDLRRNATQQPPSSYSRLRLLDEATLQRMKREKLAGASNLFDVPLEIIHSSSQSDMSDVEYISREIASRILDRV